MPIKVYHPDHGFVLTNSQDEIDMLLAKGGKVVVKNSEAFAVEETEKPAIPPFNRTLHNNKRR